MNTSLKDSTNSVIASIFKKRLANVDADISVMKNKMVNTEIVYNCLISEDPTVVAQCNATDFVDRCISYEESLRRYEETRASIIAAFNAWKAYSDYTLDDLI